MFTTSLIIFREVFEIVLIVGIILAATRGIAGRKWWIIAGFAGGIAGAVLIALFTDKISDFADGLGQEIFNAGILFTAAIFIGWTVLWMQKHARNMKQQFNDVGQKIKDGNTHFITISFVIALAILREGAEIVLFSYGMMASGQSMTQLLMGGAIGLAGGLLVGGLLYIGLINISVKYFMRVTSIMLVLLVAGMVSQGFGMLIAAGYFDSMSQIMWNSSWLLSEQNIIGETLKTLIGYTSRPALIQLIAYAVTILFFVACNYKINCKSTSLA